MRIAIDARMIRSGSMHGIARYVFQLLECLKTKTLTHSFFLIINPESPLRKLSWPDHIHLITTKAPWISLREQIMLPLLLKKWRIDLLHAPSFVAPVFCSCRLVMTIHDLNHLVLPHFYTAFHQFYYRNFVARCVRHSDRVLTVSHFSKKELIKNLGIPESKIFVTYNGVSEAYAPVGDLQYLAYIKDLYEFPDEFIFCLSNNKKHKNLHVLVQAYCHANISIPLVLTSEVEQSLIRTAEVYGKKHQIYFCKFIQEEHLPAVYSMTKLFVYPSTYEGFGLPPLEALRCGTRVLVSQSTSLPEVVGQNAVFVNPFDYKEMASVLEKTLNSPPPSELEKEKAIQHASCFQWNKMTEKTLKSYETNIPLADDFPVEVLA